jgi:DnaJ-class molecular chaperone with C-terminal Zn finger domain
MTISDYYKVLDLPLNSSVDDIKKAYRQKARMYHPDINPSPDAKDMFISATEAYEFLIANFDRITNSDEAFKQAMEDWRKYRQDRSRQRARAYSQASYVRFKNTKFYRATRIMDGTTIIFSLLISIAVIGYTIFGYQYRLKHPLPETENPTFFTFIMLLLLGMVFFVISLVYLKVYIETSKKRKQKTH